jgi:hypothetical protein
MSVCLSETTIIKNWKELSVHVRDSDSAGGGGGGSDLSGEEERRSTAVVRPGVV